jgi:hypothetical protein
LSDTDAFGERERAHGAEVDRARQALADQRGVRGLVDHDLVDQFGGELVELDGAVVADAHLLAPVHQRRAVVAGQAADAEGGRTARDTLGGEAGQAREGVRDRDVRQLAEILGRDHSTILSESILTSMDFSMPERMPVTGDRGQLGRLFLGSCVLLGLSAALASSDFAGSSAGSARTPVDTATSADQSATLSVLRLSFNIASSSPK